MIRKFEKERYALLVSILINVLFLVGVVAVVGVHYGMSDDWFIARNIADGSYNMAFCNYFIQVVSVLLQKLIYPYNAFMILQVFFGFVSLTTISYILLDCFKVKKGIWLVLFINCVFAAKAYATITFTATAGFLMVAGGFLMLWAYHEKKHIGYSIFGIVLVLFGYFYRHQVFYSILAVFGVFIVGSVLAKVDKGNFFKSLFKVIREILTVKTVALVLAMFVLVFSCKYISTSMVYSTEDMEYYRQFNSARSKVVDWPIGDYDANAEEYKSLGISKNDYNMLLGWYFDDEGYSDVETLKKIGDLADVNVDVVNRVKSMVYTLIMDLVTFEQDGILMLAYLIVAVVMLILYKKSWLFVGATAFSIGLLYTYLYINGRVRFRLVVGFFLAAIVLLIYAARFLEKRKFADKLSKDGVFAKVRKVILTTVSVIVLVAFALITNLKMAPSLFTEVRTETSNLSNYISSTEGKVFALSPKSFSLLRDSTVVADLLYIGDNEMLSKCVYYGSPYYAHPSYNRLLADVGVENLYTDIVDNEMFYFMGKEDCYSYDGEKYNEVDMLVTYLNEQYGDRGEYIYQFVDRIEELEVGANAPSVFGVYKIVTVK